MKPSLNHQYQVEGLILQNTIIILLRESDGYLSPNIIKSISVANRLFNEVTSNVQALQDLDFSLLLQPHTNYANQQAIHQQRLDMATAAIIHYGLHPRMLIRYLKGEYVGEARDVAAILKEVSPHITEEDSIN
jgi:hypothetical protein